MVALANGREIRGEVYHYTCAHGHAAFQEATKSLQIAHLRPADGQMVWMTDLDFVYHPALAIEADSDGCVAGEFRYRVVDPARDGVMWWLDARKKLDQGAVWGYELVDGVMPVHWYVSAVPVQMIYDPAVPARTGSGADRG